MKKPSIWQVLALLAGLAPLLYLASVWPQMPARVPIHFNLNGDADRMGDAATEWLLAALPLGVLLTMSLLPRIDPKRRLDAGSANFQKLVLTLVLGLSAFSCLATQGALAGHMSGQGALLVLCAMFVLMGNYLASVPPNYFAGIRTPWTLENPIVWQRTHRVGGRGMVVAGLLGLLACALLPTAWTDEIVLTLLLGVSLGSVAYSYVVWRRLNAELTRSR